MKRIIIIFALIAILALPAFSQVRLDLGVSVPMTLGYIGQGEIRTDSDIGDFLQSHIFPFPEAGLYYQFNVEPLRLALGVRVFTFILESVMWPNFLLELSFEPVFIQAQLGGLLFAAFGLYSNADFGKIILPDLSIWIGLGKERRFRLGGGVLGLALPELTTEGIGIAPYLGGRVSLLF
jgi:hypothetical protein